MYSTPDHKSQEGWDPAVALPQGTRTDENVLSLVFRDPPANPVLRVRVAQKSGLHLVGNTRARDGPSWSSVLSGNKFTSIFRIFFFFWLAAFRSQYCSHSESSRHPLGPGAEPLPVPHQEDGARELPSSQCTEASGRCSSERENVRRRN